MNFRMANLKDAKILDDLLTKLISDEKKNYDPSLESIHVKDFYKNIIGKDNHVIYLCEIDFVIVGYIYAFIDNQNKAIIDALFIEKDFRNQKIATELLKLIKDWISKKKIQTIEISVLSKNLIAKKLYKKFGFVPFKEIMKCGEK